jgi:hypothetical protein
MFLAILDLQWEWEDSGKENKWSYERDRDG